ncbi:MAG: serine/threonine-protein kinase [Planctomycetaceae bacterium]
MPTPQQQQELLLAQLVRGEITQSAYEAKVAELRSGGFAGGGPGKTPRPLAAAPRMRLGTGSGVQPGTVLANQFRIREQLGRGGMGEVWKAYDTIGDRDAVIKVLPPELQGNTHEMERVQQTFRRVHDLQHQHICPTHFLGEDPAVGYFLVMKYINGVTLREYWRSGAAGGKLPVSQVPAILRPVADALDYAHRKHVVHRDIKPDNIMVDRNGRDPQIVDFGLAAEIRNSQARVTKARMETGGTYPYMAPEQWKGQPQDGRTDQYALGVVAYELLAGRLPFADRDPQVMRKRVLSEAIPPITGLPPVVTQVLSRVLAKEPAHRFESCSAFLVSLSGALAGAVSTRTAAPPPIAGLTGALPPALGSSSGEYSGALPPPVSTSRSGEHDMATEPADAGPKLPSRLRRIAAHMRSRVRKLREKLAGLVRQRPRWKQLPPWAWVIAGAVGVLVVVLLIVAATGWRPFGPRIDFNH